MKTCASCRKTFFSQNMFSKNSFRNIFLKNICPKIFCDKHVFQQIFFEAYFSNIFLNIFFIFFVASKSHKMSKALIDMSQNEKQSKTKIQLLWEWLRRHPLEQSHFYKARCQRNPTGLFSTGHFSL